MKKLLVFVLVIFSINALAEGKKPVVLKWMVAHYPNDYFLKMAEYLKGKIEKETENRVQIEIIDDKIYEQASTKNSKEQLPLLRSEASFKKELLKTGIKGYSKEEISKLIHQNKINEDVFIQRLYAFKLMVEGKVDMAQSYTYFLGRVVNHEYLALELPYIFKDYNHIEKFIESKDANDLLGISVKEHGLRGLAYTYSGGLLVTMAKAGQKLNHPENWKNLKIKKTASYVRNQYFNNLGLDNENKKVDKLLELKSNKAIRPTGMILQNIIDVAEINLPDVVSLLAKQMEVKKEKILKLSITETQHSLLSTIFLINEKSFQKLSPKDQEILKKLALDAGKMERDLTIERYEVAKKYLIDNGFEWNKLSPESRSEFVTASKSVYEKVFEKYPETKNIVDAIQKLN